MSTRKPPLLFLLLSAALAATSVPAENPDQAALDYYWSGAQKAAAAHDPAEAGVTYSFTARSYYRVTDDHGLTVRIDSLIARYFYTGEKLDSQVTRSGDPGKFSRLDLSVPPLFGEDFHLNFYPNDTGGERLAIGFVADSTVAGLSDGLIVLDRNSYHPLQMYLYYRNYQDYKRYTRALRFTDVGEWFFPDSVWTVATRTGIFATESYRLETGISDITINQ